MKPFIIRTLVVLLSSPLFGNGTNEPEPTEPLPIPEEVSEDEEPLSPAQHEDLIQDITSMIGRFPTEGFDGFDPATDTIEVIID